MISPIISLSIIGAVIFLSLFFLFLNLKDKIELNKLRRNFNGSGQTKQDRIPEGFIAKPETISEGKPVITGNAEFEGRELLENTTSIPTSADERNSIEDSGSEKQPGFFGKFRRKKVNNNLL